MKHLAETPPAPSDLRPDVPNDLDLVVIRALAKEPADRYSVRSRHGRRPGDRGAWRPGGDRDGGGRDDGARGRRCHRCDRCDPDRAPSPTSPVRTAEARTPALAMAPGNRRGARAPDRGLVLLRLDPAPDPGRGDGRRPVRRRDPAGSREAEHHGRRADPAGSPRRELRRRGGRRLRAEPDGGHARRQGDSRPHRRLVGQTRGDDPERRRPDRRGRRRRAHPSRPRRAGRRGQLRQGRGYGHRAVAGQPAPWSSKGTQIRINVSQGPKPVSVPNVVGLPYDQAASELQRAGFISFADRQDSDQAAGSSSARPRAAARRARRARR